MPLLGTAQLAARVQGLGWFKDGLVVAPLMKSFEDTLYRLYKPRSARKYTPELQRALDMMCGTSDESVSRPASKKPIPAPDDERHEFIRKLILARVGPEAIGCDIREAPLELILSTADSAVFLTVEEYYMFRDRGLSEQDAVKELNEYQTKTLAVIGQELPLMKHPATLFDYVRHFIDSQFGDAEPIRDEVLRVEIEAVKNFYRR